MNRADKVGVGGFQLAFGITEQRRNAFRPHQFATFDIPVPGADIGKYLSTAQPLTAQLEFCFYQFSGGDVGAD